MFTWGNLFNFLGSGFLAWDFSLNPPHCFFFQKTQGGVIFGFFPPKNNFFLFLKRGGTIFFLHFLKLLYCKTFGKVGLFNGGGLLMGGFGDFYFFCLYLFWFIFFGQGGNKTTFCLEGGFPKAGRFLNKFYNGLFYFPFDYRE